MDKMPDYSKYTLDQLYDVYDHIDREKYPERFQIIVSEIEKRKIEKAAKKDEEKYKGNVYGGNLVCGECDGKRRTESRLEHQKQPPSTEKKYREEFQKKSKMEITSEVLFIIASLGLLMMSLIILSTPKELETDPLYYDVRDPMRYAMVFILYLWSVLAYYYHKKQYKGGTPSIIGGILLGVAILGIVDSFVNPKDYNSSTELIATEVVARLILIAGVIALFIRGHKKHTSL